MQETANSIINQMKIAITCFNLSWQAGGVRLIYSEARALKNLGHRVIIYAPDFNPEVYPELAAELDIRAVSPPRPIFWQYKSKNLWKRIFEKLGRGRAVSLAAEKIAAAMDADFDIVNLHDFSYLLAPLYKRRNPKAKIVWTMNDPPYNYLPKSNFLYDVLSRAYNAWKDISERRYFRFVDAAVTLMEGNKKWLEERGMRAEVVWSGLDFEKFYVPLKQPKKKSDRWNFLCVGALNRYRRFEDAISAIKILRDKGYDIFLKIVCKNIWQEDEYKKELEAFVSDHGLEKYVELLFQGVSESELPKIYAASDVLIVPIHLPPPRSGFGWQLVPFEAMAAGTPVIVCRTNDVTEALRDNETAIFVDPMSPLQIAEKIEQLIEQPDFYYKIALGGQDFVRGNMSWEKYAKKILDVAARK